ncbi:Zn finger protein [Lokiarchaeota virus WyrdV1]|nr:Zn finger protein [Lokiarchaeota virus WyrdV1]
MIELKRIYKCPNCDAIVLEKVYFNTIHRCSCGVDTHANNLLLQLQKKDD